MKGWLAPQNIHGHFDFKWTESFCFFRYCVCMSVCVRTSMHDVNMLLRSTNDFRLYYFFTALKNSSL